MNLAAVIAGALLGLVALVIFLVWVERAAFGLFLFQRCASDSLDCSRMAHGGFKVIGSA